MDFTHEPGRYVLAVDGRTVGRVDYVDVDDARVFTHSEVDPAMSGRGYGHAVVRHALKDTRAEGKRIVPRCSFVARVAREAA